MRKLSPRAIVANLVIIQKSNSNSLMAFKSIISQQGPKVKVNHQFVDNLEQKLRMGDLMEVMKPFSLDSLSIKTPSGKIMIECQREQIRRLYLEGMGTIDERNANPMVRRPSIASLPSKFQLTQGYMLKRLNSCIFVYSQGPLRYIHSFMRVRGL